MGWGRLFVLICAGILTGTAVGLALLLGFGDLGLGAHGAVALIMGVLLTMAIAMVLMGLMFLSSRSGRDDEVHAAWNDSDANR